ncbi:MAG: hypothetical protein HQM01_10015 [Magnetococcales bacterium]|nr:hypothetical protein [Magnetococcales bacterium]
MASILHHAFGRWRGLVNPRQPGASLDALYSQMDGQEKSKQEEAPFGLLGKVQEAFASIGEKCGALGQTPCSGCESGHFEVVNSAEKACQSTI